MIRAKIDEDLPRDLVEILAGAGIDGLTVHQQGWAGRPDDILFQGIQPEGRWLFTADKGFGDIRRFPPGSHNGIVLFRAERESRANFIELTRRLLAQADLDQCPKALIVVTFRGIRILRSAAGTN